TDVNSNESESFEQKLIAQIEALTKRVNELEAASGHQKADSDEAAKSISNIIETHDKMSWAERISFKGDFRYRYENIDEEFKARDRNRSRIRARIEAQARINDDFKVGVGLASGGDDPVSSNQTLGGGGTSKDIKLDTAYFDWSGMRNTHVIGGKFKNPFFIPASHGLLWDGDYRPEGMAIKFDNDRFFANGLVLQLESDNKAGSQDAESAWAGQFGFYKELSDGAQIILGASYYNIPVAGSKPFFDDNAFGNTLVSNGSNQVYKYNYEELELFGMVNFQLAGLPASVFADWVENQDAQENENGWAAGMQLGKAKAPGSWQLAYIYQDLEADAVFGLTTDSDFAGGGTNSSGHVIKAAYASHNNTSFALSYFINERGDHKTDYDRLMLDLNFKY
ncbi:MAG: hypothetical protein ACI9H8_001849, partial [Lysobacterales bacterium]